MQKPRYVYSQRMHICHVQMQYAAQSECNANILSSRPRAPNAMKYDYYDASPSVFNQLTV